MIHLEPITYIARAYAPGDSFDARSDYIASCVVQVCGDMAYVSGAHGTMTLANVREFNRRLRGMGVTQLAKMRHGEMRFEQL